jgi:ATP-dependent helicase/nuclease subunit B
MRRWMARFSDPAGLDIWEWLFSLPGETQILGSGPREGKLHVAPIFGGGHSGRPYTFIVGMDDSRFPGPGMQDPILLDSERQKLSPDLTTAIGLQHENTRGFARLLAGLRGHVALSYSRQNLLDDREMFPSPILLNVFRIISGQPQADQKSLEKSIGPPISFAPRQSGESLSESEWWLSQLGARERLPDAEHLIADRYPHLAQGFQAKRQRESNEFTDYDGLVPEAGRALDPTRGDEDAPVMSTGQFELIGKCPLAFFFRHGLEIVPPKELTIDSASWLDPPSRGLLLHTVFEQFIRELMGEQRQPVFDRDLPRLQAILETQVMRYLDTIPSPNESAYRSQLALFEEMARIFLKEEEELCRARDCVPVHLEVSLGMKHDGPVTPIDSEDPILLVLPSGKMIKVRGRVDRIDRIGSGAIATFGIWDYKTGSTYRYTQGGPFHQGRIVQPTIYLAMVGHRLRQIHSQDVEVTSFGFFFPDARECGERLVWTRKDLNDGVILLQHLCDLIGQGAFPATTDSKDCTFCDYNGICGDVEEVAAHSRQKLANQANTMLTPFRELRA